MTSEIPTPQNRRLFPPGIFRLLRIVNAKTNRPFGRRRWLYELADRVEEIAKLGVVAGHAPLQFCNLGSQFFVDIQHASHLGERSNDKDTHLRGTGAAEDVRGHEGAVLCKNIRSVFSILITLFVKDHNL